MVRHEIVCDSCRQPFTADRFEGLSLAFACMNKPGGGTDCQVNEQTNPEVGTMHFCPPCIGKMYHALRNRYTAREQ